MATGTTLQIDSFADINLLERTALAEGVLAGAEEISVQSVQGYEVGQSIYIGQLSREGIERAVIESITGETMINLADPLVQPHQSFDPVTSVVGWKAKIYRAAVVEGSRSAPDDSEFAELSTREIDADQLSTYYRDPDGSSQYWYKYTYFDPDTTAETSLADSVAVRGDDFGHYASLSEIRSEAGFENAYNLKDSLIDQQRRATEAYINTALSTAYTTPFDPVPEIVHTFTIKLAAAMLLYVAYGGKQYEKDVETVKKEIQALAEGDGSIPDEDGNSTSNATIDYYPTDEQSRAFTMDQRF